MKIALASFIVCALLMSPAKADDGLLLAKKWQIVQRQKEQQIQSTLKIGDYIRARDNKTKQQTFPALGGIYYLPVKYPANAKIVDDLKPLCVPVSGHGLNDIVVTDSEPYPDDSTEVVTVSGGLGSDILEKVGIKLGLSAEVEIKTEVTSARERAISEKDASRIYKKLVAGPVCRSNLPKAVKERHFQLTGYTYGRVKTSYRKKGSVTFFATGGAEKSTSEAGWAVFKVYGDTFDNGPQPRIQSKDGQLSLR